MQAITTCAFVLQYNGDGFGLSGWSGSGLTILVIVLSFLMVSRVKYDTIPKLSKRQIKAHPWKVVGLVSGLLGYRIFKGNTSLPYACTLHPLRIDQVCRAGVDEVI